MKEAQCVKTEVVFSAKDQSAQKARIRHAVRAVFGMSRRPAKDHDHDAKRDGNAFIRVLACILLAVGSVGIPRPVNATSVTFFSPDSATASNTNLAGASPTNLINRSGIGASPVTLDNIGTTLHSDDGTTSGGWRGSAFALPITLVFDFNASQRIDYIGLWQWDAVSQGTGDFTVAFWDGPNGTGNQIGSVYSGVLDTGSGNIPLNGRAFDVGPRTGVDSISMVLLSVAHPTINGNVHLGEFMVAGIPEPSIGWLLAAGLPLLMGLARRQRKV